MKITEISPAYNVIISARSITVKNPETDKTAGVIRGIELFNNAPINKQVAALEKLKKVAPGAGRRFDFGTAVICDGNIYVIVSNYSIDIERAFDPASALVARYEEAKAAGLPIIHARRTKKAR